MQRAVDTERFLERSSEPLFVDRADAGRRLTRLLAGRRGTGAVVVGLARGGVVVAAEIAAALQLELDAVAVRKVRHPLQPEFAIGAVTPDDGLYLQTGGGLTETGVRAAVLRATSDARALEQRLQGAYRARALRDRHCVLVDDGLATGATMVAAVRWARRGAAATVTAAVPVASPTAADLVRAEADELVCLYEVEWFLAVGVHYESFAPVTDEQVIELLTASRRRLSEPAAMVGS